MKERDTEGCHFTYLIINVSNQRPKQQQQFSFFDKSNAVCCVVIVDIMFSFGQKRFLLQSLFLLRPLNWMPSKLCFFFFFFISSSKIYNILTNNLHYKTIVQGA